MVKNLIIVLLIFFSSQLFTQPPAVTGKQEDPDMEALYRWIQNKRLVTIKELGGDLSLSAEVRVEMQATNEKKNGVRQRGRGGATRRANCAYDVEVNLMLDYLTERTWAAVKLEFDNDMGTVSGTTRRIALERAYLGGKIYMGETFDINAGIGRRYLNNIFDSRVEFSSLFDGVLFKINKAFEKAGDLYVNMGVFLVDDRKNHYGYIGETGMLGIGNSGFYVKYSFVDWKKNYQDIRKDLAFNFMVSQAILGYQVMIERWNKIIKLYAAGLINHVAKKIDLTRYKKANKGFYVGFSIGQIRRKGDWAFDTNYQYIEAQTIPSFDAGGIKRGNAAGINFYTTGPYGRGAYTTVDTAVGGCNYKGWLIEFLYALTNNLTLLNNFQISKNVDDSIGPKMRYYQYEVEFIYAF